MLQESSHQTGPDDLESRVRRLEQVTRWLVGRVSALDADGEAEAALPPKERRSPSASPPPSRATWPTPDTRAGVTPPTAVPDRVAAPKPVSSDVSHSTPTGGITDDEMRLVSRWAAWLGAAALVLSAAFFLGLAFENGWIGPAGRVGLGLAAGIALLAIGERVRRPEMGWLPDALSAGGLAVIYLAIYAAYHRYGLVPFPAAFGGMALATALGAAVAIHADSPTLLAAAAAGGYLTPVLVQGGGAGSPGSYFTYLALLGAGLVATAEARGWRRLSLLAFMATTAHLVAWAETRYSLELQSPWLLFLATGGALFLVPPLRRGLTPDAEPDADDVALMAVSPLAFGGMAAGALLAGHREMVGAGVLGLGAALIALGELFQRRNAAAGLLRYAAHAAGAAFVAAAPAIAFSSSPAWMGIGWAAESAALIWGGMQANSPPMRYVAYVIQAALATWLVAQPFPTPAHALPLLNPGGVVLSCAIAAAGLTAALIARHRDRLPADEQALYLPAILVANGLALVLLTREAGRLAGADAPFAQTAVWLIYGLAVLQAGLSRPVPALWRAGAFVVIAAASKAFLMDPMDLANGTVISTFFNLPFLGMVLAVGALFAAGTLLSLEPHADSDAPLWATAMAVLGTLGGLVALSMDLWWGLAQNGGAAQFALSALWAAYAAVCILAGLGLRRRGARVFGIALLAVAVAKVFLYDTQTLEAGYRVLSLLALGLLLLAVAYAYGRTKATLRQG